MHGIDLALQVRGRPVDHVHDEVGFEHYLECRPERLDHLMGQLAHEADGVGQQHGLPSRQVELSGSRIERREQPVLHQHIRGAQPVQQRRLPGVGIADQRDSALAASLTALALHCPGAVELA